MKKLSGCPENCRALGQIIHDLSNGVVGAVEAFHKFKKQFEKGEFNEYIADLNEFRVSRNFPTIETYLNESELSMDKKAIFLQAVTMIIEILFTPFFGKYYPNAAEVPAEEKQTEENEKKTRKSKVPVESPAEPVVESPAEPVAKSPAEDPLAEPTMTTKAQSYWDRYVKLKDFKEKQKIVVEIVRSEYAPSGRTPEVAEIFKKFGAAGLAGITPEQIDRVAVELLKGVK